MTPSHSVIFLKGNLLRISSSLEVMLGYFCFTDFGVLELSRWWFHWVRCSWILLGLSELSFLVNWLGSNLPCLLFLILDLARSCRACLLFYSIFLFVLVSCGRHSVSFLLFVSCGRRSVSFLVLFCLIRLVGTWSFLRWPWFWMFVFFRFK